ncbi:MAG: hypothetical protein PVS3B1_07580 [Ktedonobacteraceae bacterium]
MQERSRRRDAGVLQVTERDLLALTWIAAQYCISYDHLQCLLAYYTSATTKRPDKVAPSTAQNAIERWLQLGYVDIPRKIIREHPTYLWVSRKGLKDLELPYAYYTPKPSTIRHIYAVNAVRLHLQGFQLSAAWVAQRTVRTRTERRPLPDAELQMQASPIAALQIVEQHRLLTISIQDELNALQAFAHHYTRIWYFVHAQTLHSLEAAIRQHDAIASPDKQLMNRIVWYGLDAREIVQL